MLCRVGAHDYLHLTSAIDGARFEISNNHGFINGWIGADDLSGRCVRIEP